MYQGFYTRQADAQIRKRKRYPILNELDCSYLSLDRLGSDQGWRFASSWRKPDEQSSAARYRSERDEGEDWYGRWKRQKSRQYDEFVRRVEQDPYRALFGASNRLLGWLDQARPGSASPESTRASSQAGGTSSEIRNSSPNELPAKTWPYDGSIQSGHADGANSRFAEDQEYEIDPITLHKVPKLSSRPSTTLKNTTKPEQDVNDIPVKKFSPSASTSRTQASSTIPSFQAETASNQQNWLSKEDFHAKEGQTIRNAAESHKITVAAGETPKIESALDRYIQNIKPKSMKSRESTTGFDSKETQDDVDLLRTSDVRASAGLRGRSAKEEASAKQSRQKILEDSYERRLSELDSLLAKELASSKSRPATDYSSAPPNGNIFADPHSNSSTEFPGKVSAPANSYLTSGHVGRIRAKLVPLKTKIDMLKEDYAYLRKQLIKEKHRLEEAAKRKATRKAQEMLDQEVKAQQAAMNAIELGLNKDPQLPQSASQIPHEESHGEGDMASNVHEFAGRARWYKRKAPHAECEMDAKLKRLASEKEFVREIRGIYEDTYGKIDTEHRQHSTSREEVTAMKSAKAESTDIQSRHGDEQDRDQRPKLGAGEMLSIRHDIFGELDLLAFKISSYQKRASLEPNSQTRESITKEFIGSALESFDKLFSSALRLIQSYDTCNLDEARQHIRAALTSARLGLTSDSSQPNSESSVSGIGSLDVKQMEQVPSDSRSPTCYRILAYDNSSQKVSSAKTSLQTPFVGEKALTPLQALGQLQNPGKFLPHLVTLHNKGYDIVSGANDILILKKVRDAVISKDDYFGRPNPVDGTTTPEVSTGNFASPTGFVNHNPVIPTEEVDAQRSAPPRPVDKVRREEDVFSGNTRRSWQEGKRISKKDKRRVRRHKTLKRMLLTGLLTAAACYTTGVVIEMMHL